MNRFFTLLFLLALPYSHILAQTTTGTEFWLGYMENLDLIFNGVPSFAVIISAEEPTSGAIEVPATGLSIPFTVGAGTTEITLPAAIWYSETSEQVDNKGIRIVSTQPVRVQAYHYRIFFNESSNPGEGWDGTFNGKAHPQEVLVYICQLTFSNGVSQEIKGDVTLILITKYILFVYHTYFRMEGRRPKTKLI